MKKNSLIILNILPVLIMVGLISLVANDYLLALIYLAIIAALLVLKRTPNDIIVLVFGFVAMTLFEYIFISTGVETFKRSSLFGLMPIWLPVLWAYGFVAIKRSVEILSNRY